MKLAIILAIIIGFVPGLLIGLNYSSKKTSMIC